MRASVSAVWMAIVAATGFGWLTGTSAEAGVRVNSFSGSCSLQGTARFSPPATNEQQSLSAVYDATGTCTGTLNGREISNASVRAHNAAHGVDGSCVRADTTRPGRGSLTFPDGTRILFSSEFHFFGTNGTFTLRGEQSGSAHGIGSFVTPRTPPDLPQQCAGEGVSRAPLDLTLSTDSPLVSRRRSSESPKAQKTLTGTAENDVLIGSHGNDVIECGAGHDRVAGRGGDDVILCGSGHDLVAGGDGDDRVHGGSGDDRLAGDGGDDALFGQSGDDRLDGGPGADRLDGGPGEDSTDGRGPRSAAISFSGQCQFSGVVRFEPPLTNEPGAVSQRVRAPGACSGTLVDRRGRSHQLSDARATFAEASRGESASCLSGSAVGRGSLAFRLGTIRFAFRETRIGGTVVGEAVGDASGSARGVGSVSSSEDPAAIAQRCAGRGLEKVRVDVQLTTSPAISG